MMSFWLFVQKEKYNFIYFWLTSIFEKKNFFSDTIKFKIYFMYQ